MNHARIIIALVAGLTLATQSRAVDYAIVDTGQTRCYDNRGPIAPPKPGQPFHGQDAQYQGAQADYKDNGDGTISDLTTGLTWVKARGEKLAWEDAVAGAANCRIGGFKDWRMPTIKELYSLIDFNGGCAGTIANSRPYIDAKVFDFVYGDESKGARIIDSQDWSATQYIGKTMSGNPTVFGVNFADGRIKGYPKQIPGGRRGAMYSRYVRGNPLYGKNDFRDNSDGTIADRGTGLIWQKADSGKGMNWQQALAYAANLKLAGKSDWRLPNAKELQSIVDYTRVPAIDPMFQITALGDGEHPFFWTSTSHLEGPLERQGTAAVYVCFGRGLGWMTGPRGGEPRLLDVHGAGAQRSDPKTGDPADFPHGRGPQGDVIRIDNFVRCVRGGGVVLANKTAAASTTASPAPADPPAPAVPLGEGPPGGFRLIRKFASDKMNLSEQQQRLIAELERETKAKLSEILTPEQMKALEDSRPPRPF